MNMLVEYTYAGRSNFRQVFAEGASAAEAAFREWNGLGDDIVTIYRAASIHDGKPNQSRVVVQFWSAAVTGWDFFKVYEQHSVAQALENPPRSDARPVAAWIAM